MPDHFFVELFVRSLLDAVAQQPLPLRFDQYCLALAGGGGGLWPVRAGLLDGRPGLLQQLVQDRAGPAQEHRHPAVRGAARAHALALDQPAADQLARA
ncbi:hypothetical protein D3C80_2008620 [compost metagenome]